MGINEKADDNSHQKLKEEPRKLWNNAVEIKRQILINEKADNNSEPKLKECNRKDEKDKSISKRKSCSKAFINVYSKIEKSKKVKESSESVTLAAEIEEQLYSCPFFRCDAKSSTLS